MTITHFQRITRLGIKSNPTQFIRRKFSSNPSIYETVKSHPNSGLKYLGGAGALALGGYVAYSASRPASYIPSSTRDAMSNIGGVSFANMVRTRIMKTYGYLSASIAVTGLSTYMLLTRGIGARIMMYQMRNPLMFTIGSLAGLWMSIGLTMGVNGQSSPLLKHGAWLSTNGLFSLTLLSLTAMAGGAIVQQAALITGCIIGSMSLAAMASPSDYFLKMGPYLGVGLGLIIAASFGSMFFPGSSLLMNVSLYGGVGLFGLYTAFDTQRVLHDAQVAPTFDPINQQMGLYLDTINIFVRIVQILMMQQSRRR